MGARTGIGFSGNLSTPTYSGIMDINNGHPNTAGDSSPVFSFNAGILTQFLFSESNYGFELQFNYVKFGSYLKDELTKTEKNLSIYGLEIALAFKMSLLSFYGPSTDVHHPYILIGPFFYLPCFSKIDNQDINNNFNGFNIGVFFTLGGRFRLKGRSIIFIELVFKSLLSDELKTRGTLRNYAFYFNIGYEFKLSKSEWD